MHKTFTLFTALLLFTCTATFAQTNYKAGYIVEAKGDTIHGLLDDRGDQRNSHLLHFKLTGNSPVKEYLPADLTAFNVGSKIYHSIKVMENDQTFQVFSELINDGEMKFYHWKDKADNNRFYVAKDGSLYELTNPVEKVVKGGRTYAYESRAHIGLLNALTPDCDVKAKSNLRLNIKDISNYVAEYNACKGGYAYNSEKPEKKIILKKSVYTGVNITEVAGKGNDAIIKETTSDKKLSAGIGLHLNFPGMSEKLFLDLIAEYNNKGATAENTGGDYVFNMHLINFNPGISYVYPKGRIRPVVGVGLVTGYILNKESAFIRHRNDRQDRVFNMAPYNDDEATIEIGYELKGGLKYELKSEKFIVFKARYSKSLIDFNFITHSYYNEVLSLQVGYEF